MKEEGDVRWGERPESEGQLVELVGDQNPGPEAPSRRKKGERGGSKGNVKGGAMGKGRYVKIIDGEEIRGDDPIEYFLPTGFRSTSSVSERLMAIKVSKNEKISGGVKDGGRKGISSAIRPGKANRGA